MEKGLSVMLHWPSQNYLRAKKRLGNPACRYGHLYKALFPVQMLESDNL